MKSTGERTGGNTSGLFSYLFSETEGVWCSQLCGKDDNNYYSRNTHIIQGLLNNSKKKNITSEFKNKDKYYYYSYLLDENNKQFEIFEIVDPKKNNSIRELGIKAEEQ